MGGVEAYTPELLVLARECQQWVTDLLAHKPEAHRTLVICGNSGTGKTAMLKAINKALITWRIVAWDSGAWKTHPPEVMFQPWLRWANLDTSKADDADLFFDLMPPDVLLLDDIGAEPDKFRSGLGVANLTYLLSERQSAKKFTAMTTNYLPEQWVGTESKPGRFGVRLGDRLFRDSVIVPIRATQSWVFRNKLKP